jgi:NitT/TauT family transport system ATP-binding protein
LKQQKPNLQKLTAQALSDSKLSELDLSKTTLGTTQLSTTQLSTTATAEKAQANKTVTCLDRLKGRPMILQLEGLSKKFGPDLTILKDINLGIHRREFLTVIGPSGCGKSTLARTLAGLETITNGKAMINGEPITGPGPDRGMVFQKYTLFPWLTVKQNIMFGLTSQGRDKSQAEGEAREWIEIIGLTKFSEHYPSQLSGGMQQRVAIARSLATRPKVLLMDEPFGALDAQTRLRMQQHLIEIWQNIDVTVVFITHDLDEAIYLADRILVLKPNPGEIQSLVDVPLPRPRLPEHLKSNAFHTLKQELAVLIHSHDQSEDVDEPLHMFRMTNVDDDAE